MESNGNGRPREALEPLLLPCPFCGGWSVLLFGEADEDGEEFSEGNCHECSSYGPSIWGYDLDEVEALAYQAWNVRGGPVELLCPSRRGVDGKVEAAEVEGHSPCPWCASKRLYLDDMSDHKVVMCDNCGGGGPAPEFGEERSDPDEMEKQAWELWDHRPPPWSPILKPWTHWTSHQVLEGVIEKVGDHDLVLRSKDENFTICLAGLPACRKTCLENVGWEVRIRTRMEALKPAPGWRPSGSPIL